MTWLLRSESGAELGGVCRRQRKGTRRWFVEQDKASAVPYHGFRILCPKALMFLLRDALLTAQRMVPWKARSQSPSRSGFPRLILNSIQRLVGGHSSRFTEIIGALQHLLDDTVIDEETVALDGVGRPSFSLHENSRRPDRCLAFLCVWPNALGRRGREGFAAGGPRQMLPGSQISCIR